MCPLLRAHWYERISLNNLLWRILCSDSTGAVIVGGRIPLNHLPLHTHIHKPSYYYILSCDNTKERLTCLETSWKSRRRHTESEHISKFSSLVSILASSVGYGSANCQLWRKGEDQYTSEGPQRVVTTLVLFQE